MPAADGRTSRRRFLQGLSGAGLGLLSGCVAASRSSDVMTVTPTPVSTPLGVLAAASEAPLGPPVTVRVGQVVATSEAGQFIALERGYFREQGIEVEYTQFDAAGRMTPLLASGQLDIGTGAVGAGLFNALARGVPIKIVGPQARHDPGASAVYVMVRQDLVGRGVFRDYVDLRGRTIAVNARGVATEYGAALALERGGLQLGDAELVELSFADMIAAFANQAIDVAIQNEPAATQAASRGVAVKWREMGEVQPGIQFTVVLYAPDFARHEAARRWMVAYLRGVRDYNDAFVKHHGRDAVVDILTRHTSLRDPELYTQMGFAYIDPNGRVDATSLAEQLQWYVQQGQVPQPPDLRQAIDASFVEFALERLGPYV